MNNISQTKSEVVSRYVMKSYTVMFITLLITTVLATIITFSLQNVPGLQKIVLSPITLIVLLIGQLAIGFLIRRHIPMKNDQKYVTELKKDSLNYNTAYMMLGLFIVIESIFFALIVGTYNPQLVISALATTVVLYGATAIAGYRFKLMKNVRTGYLVAGGVAILVMSVFNLLFFRGNPLISLLVSIGIIIISTIYNMANHASIEDEADLIMQGEVPEKSMVLIKAFQFYNTFLSMFYSILRIFSLLSGD
jgi:FtsH-binding integral membrane protein